MRRDRVWGVWSDRFPQSVCWAHSGRVVGYCGGVESNDQQERGWAKPGVGLPVAHLLALAPLDVWLRLLGKGSGVHARYWPRLAFVLFTSFVGTVSTVHERLLLALYFWLPVGRARLARHRPEVIVILGYYRSGTTHLHNLMSCDRGMVTPRWYQCLAGQGFWLGWTVLRVLLVPFLGRTRPQDSVGFGPEWPGEDDFALATWGGCSSIAGRYVFPSAWDDWKRWHHLEDLDEAQVATWRRLTKRFVFKITRGAGDRVVVLKTPSHTARVAELDRLFAGRVRFVHLVRDPGAVIDSNVRMMHALRGHLLEDAPDVQTLRTRVVEEYAATEQRCAEALEEIEPDRWVRVRFKDLRSDPMGTLGTIYDGLGIVFGDTTKKEMRSYLGSLGSYSAQREAIDLGEEDEQERRVCAQMSARYGLDAPAKQGKPLEYTPRPMPRAWRGAIAGLAVAMMCWGSWVLLVGGIHALDNDIRMRMVVLVWLCGALIGLGARRGSGGRGTRGLGLWCAGLTLVTVVTVLFPVSVINWNWAADDGMAMWLKHNWLNVWQGLSGTSSMVLVVLAMLTAYRHASQDGPIVPRR